MNAPTHVKNLLGLERVALRDALTELSAMHRKLGNLTEVPENATVLRVETADLESLVEQTAKVIAHLGRIVDINSQITRELV